MRKITVYLLLVLSAFTTNAEVQLKPNDVIAFLGDSNTEAGGYTKVVEGYFRLRYPSYNLTFFNAGISGDTAVNGLARWDRDLFPPQDLPGTPRDWMKFPFRVPKPTVIIVVLGINDINWGNDLKESTIQAYLNSLSQIVKKSEEKGAKVYIASYPVIGEDTQLPVNDALESLGKRAMPLSSDGIGLDVLKETKTVLKRLAEYNQSVPAAKKQTLHIADGVHFTDLGHQAVGYGIIKSMVGTAPISKTSFTIIAKNLKLDESIGGQVTQYSYLGKSLRFNRQDLGFPYLFDIPIHDVAKEIFSYDDEISQYIIQIKGLPAGRYIIKANKRLLTGGSNMFTEIELANGVNLTKVFNNKWTPNGPWGAKSLNLKFLTDAGLNFRNVNLQSYYYLSNNPDYTNILEGLDKLKNSLKDLESLLTKPEPITFEIQKLD